MIYTELYSNNFLYMEIISAEYAGVLCYTTSHLFIIYKSGTLQSKFETIKTVFNEYVDSFLTIVR